MKETPGKQPIWTKAFIMIFAVNIFNAMGFNILTPILPKYAISLAYGNTVAGIIGTGFTLSAVVMRLLLVKINLNGKYRKFLILSLGIIAISIAGFAFTTDAKVLIAFRLLQGVGWGICTTVLATLAAFTLPRDRIGAGIGVFGLASTFGSALAPNLGLNLAASIGYQKTFLVALLMPCTAMLLCFFLKGIETDGGEPAARKTIVAFRDIDWRPLFPTLVMAIAMIPSSAIGSFLALAAEERGVQNIGFFFTVHAFSLFFFRPFYGRISDRIKPWVVLLPSLAAYCCVMVGLSRASTLTAYLVIALLYGLGNGGTNPTIQSWCTRMVAKEQIAMAQSLFYTGIDLGSFAGGMIVGVVADAVGYSQMYLWLIIPIVADMIILGVYAISQNKRREAVKNA